MEHFTLTISKRRYLNKPTDQQAKTARYRRQQLTLNDIAALIRKGYTLSANFVDGGAEIGQKQRTYSNFESTCFVAFDMDGDFSSTLEEVVDSLTLTPTLAYSTFSHQQAGIGNRYRLLYIINGGIHSIEEYRRIYDGICFDNNFQLKDNCGRCCVQAAFGSRSDCELICTGKLYDVSEFSTSDVGIYGEKYHSDYITERGRKNNIDSERYFSDEDFRNDFEQMDYEGLLMKYREQYCYFDHTPLPEVDDETPYILLPDNYVEIKRRYWYEPVFNDEGEQIATYQMIRRVRYGENRRKKLFIGALLRRVMLPEVRFEHLLYNMVYELFHHIDNTEAVITRQDLLQTTCSAYNAEIYPALLSRYETTKKFIVNKSYCITHHCNVYVARNRAVKMINHQRIAEFFNPDLKDKENLAILHELGIDISIATLKRFRRDHGYVKNKKHKKAHTTPAVDERQATVDAEHTLPVPNVVSASAIPAIQTVRTPDLGLVPDAKHAEEESSASCETKTEISPWMEVEAAMILETSLEDNSPENPDDLKKRERYVIFRNFAKRCRRFICQDFPLELCQEIFERRCGA